MVVLKIEYFSCATIPKTNSGIDETVILSGIPKPGFEPPSPSSLKAVSPMLYTSQHRLKSNNLKYKFMRKSCCDFYPEGLRSKAFIQVWGWYSQEAWWDFFKLVSQLVTHRAVYTHVWDIKSTPRCVVGYIGTMDISMHLYLTNSYNHKKNLHLFKNNSQNYT